MLKLYDCIADQHDLRLVCLAAAIASLAAYTALTLLRHAATVSGAERRPWVGAAALAAGAGAWATHFVAMCAYQTGFALRYGAGLTALSLLVALLAATASFGLALRGPDRTMQAVSGCLLGLGIAAMHYTGMQAMDVPGVFTWDGDLVALSVVAAAIFGACAVPLCLGHTRAASLAGATCLLMLCICTLHFLGMSALSLRFAGEMPSGTRTLISPDVLAMTIAVVCFVILLLGLAALQLNRLTASRLQREQANLRELADIAIEGLIVCDGPHIVAANSSFLQMTGHDEASVRREVLGALFEDEEKRPEFAGLVEANSECLLVSAAGKRIPVELVAKSIQYAGKPHRVLAVRDLRERREADAAIRFLAHNDTLTGIANRATFSARLLRQYAEFAREAAPFAVFTIDLDRFKEVNDALGLHIGDLLLKRVAERLRAAVRDTDLVARLGGDEFAVLVCAQMADDNAQRLSARIVEMIGRPYIIEGKVANIGASVGYAIAPKDGDEPLLLMKNADRALFRAKSSGRNTARRYENAMDIELRYSRALELDLRRAIVQGELVMHYQPLLDLGRQSISGFEALIRWRHPTRGMVPPMDFIPLAEETGLITRIGEFVLATSTAQAAGWDPSIGVAVNLSPAQFAGGQLVESVRAALARSGLAPGRLELEITESVMLSDGDDTLRTLHQLRDLGVRIAMDDFGTGYSSLHYLRAFPFDRIKIDRSFTQQILTNNESAAIISAVMALSRRLHIRTTAEGVETEEQMARVREEGCDTAQGYLIGRPLPATEIGRFMPASLTEPA